MSDETTPDTRTFRQRLRDARAEVAYLEKGGENTHFNYTFLQEAAVKKHVGAALAKHDLYIDSIRYEAIGEATGKACTLRAVVSISDVRADSGDSVLFTGIGAGSDSSDKAPMKACAAALKYALTSGFLIATGDDPEDDSRDSRPTQRTEKRAAREDRAEEAPKKAPKAGKSESKVSIEDLRAGIKDSTSLKELGTWKLAVSAAVKAGGDGAEELKNEYVAKGKELKAAEENAK